MNAFIKTTGLALALLLATTGLASAVSVETLASPIEANRDATRVADDDDDGHRRYLWPFGQPWQHVGWDDDRWDDDDDRWDDDDRDDDDDDGDDD